MKIILYGVPRTKKNSMQIIRVAGRPRLVPSKAYRDYQRDCEKQITGDMKQKIAYRANVCCTYYMPTRRKVDLCNLIEATTDILVHAGVLEDDNAAIVAGHDGSRVDYDKKNPRAEIEIEEL